MKKKRFFNDKKRNQKWTEEQTGRKIDFADKYIYNGSYSDKFDSKRPKHENTQKKKAKRQKNLKKCLIVLMCIVLICVGYTGMDVYMTREARPAELLEKNETAQTGNMADVSLTLSSCYVESVSLDSSVMLSAVIDDVVSKGYTSITFDAKRDDGTIGYASSLASVDTFGAISSPASNPKASVKELLANDILPVARICCYKDNVASLQSDMAIKKGSKLYTDSSGNAYLNPNDDTAYNYIKDIIQECISYGISVFVLYETDLPQDISDGYNDGFEYLSNRLSADLDSNIKLIEEVDVEINSKDAETGKTTKSTINKDIAAFEKITKNQIYCVETKIDDRQILEQLIKNNIQNFIIKE